jgi:hypothetical protein
LQEEILSQGIFISMARIKKQAKSSSPKVEKKEVSSPKPDIKKERKSAKAANKANKEEPVKVNDNLAWGVCESCNEKQMYRAGQFDLRYLSCDFCTGMLLPYNENGEIYPSEKYTPLSPSYEPSSPYMSPSSPAYSPSSPAHSPSEPVYNKELEVEGFEAGDTFERPIVIPSSPIYVADSDSE